MSYANICLYSATLPDYNFDKEKKKKHNDKYSDVKLNCDNPANNAEIIKMLKHYN